MINFTILNFRVMIININKRDALNLLEGVEPEPEKRIKFSKYGYLNTYDRKWYWNEDVIKLTIKKIYSLYLECRNNPRMR